MNERRFLSLQLPRDGQIRYIEEYTRVESSILDKALKMTQAGKKAK